MGLACGKQPCTAPFLKTCLNLENLRKHFVLIQSFDENGIASTMPAFENISASHTTWKKTAVTKTENFIYTLHQHYMKCKQTCVNGFMLLATFQDFP